MNHTLSADGRTPVLQAARCGQCGGHSYPANVPGCRHCGAPGHTLEAVDCMGAVPLRNVVTVHAPLAPGLAVPAIIGEIELCPGLVEEVRVDARDEADAMPGTVVRPVWIDDGQGGSWAFRPVAQSGSDPASPPAPDRQGGAQ
ncbi:hypothetical protein CURE108131_03075 [Cupriavidus respiraculi]|uniref:DUF35 domain-containing protein n=1 Tax=Cupriavidus respiraculi TaxID=195930 RepID=A0ABM8WH31_9BURK|nr:hypothetical protein [Cupriavidus respiraculi]CAG9166672.1 hypothetical protein LMG21510_00487 [Cupriavidus respiraculi]